MTDTLLIIAILLGALCALLLLILVFRKNGNEKCELKDLEQKVESTLRYADFSARTVEALNQMTETRLNNIQERLASDMKYIVDTNANNLERIRRTVDDKLSSSLDGKLSDSYAKISERLEKMYESVGEMKQLADSVSDIKRVFSNVKLRGTWGEVQLGTLLEQMLSPEQYGASVKLDPLGNSIVDFAIFLPSKDGKSLYLPVDSKFPIEEYERLCTASEQGNKADEEKARKNLEKAVKLQADSIAKKYIMPPTTTDFAVMYLPLEGLYAEVLKMDDLSAYLHNRRIIACGPTNFGALLSTLQTGFRTAAIEKRSGELVQMLSSFRSDFEKFTELLDKSRKKLQEAQDSIELAGKRTATIGKKLASFRSETETLPSDEEE